MNLMDEPFEVRRAFFRHLRQCDPAGQRNVAFEDQLDAAQRQVRNNWEQAAPWAATVMGATLTEVPEDKHAKASELLGAALLACSVCAHLERDSPMPAVVQLPLHRVVCVPCAQTKVKPPEGEDDRCDVCGSRGHRVFSAFIYRTGPLVFAGNAASCCGPVILGNAERGS